MANVILYRLRLEGQDVVIRTQKELKDAIKKANKEFDGVEEGSKRYKVLAKDIGSLKAIQKSFRDEVKKGTKEFIRDTQAQEGSFNQLRATLDLLTNEYKSLSREQREAAKGQQILSSIRVVRKEWNDLRKDLGEGLFNNFQKALQEGFSNFSGALTGDIGAIATALGAGGPLAAGLQFFSEGLTALDQFGDKIIKLRGQVQQLTDATGDELTSFTSSIMALSTAFEVPENELLLAANALTEQLTGDFDQSLALIESGFLAGADANGEFLDSIKEYPAFFKEMGLSGEQFISVISQSVDQGVFSDKGVDLIKEFELRIRELPQATVDALEAIGTSGEEIEKIIGEEGIGAAFTFLQGKLREFPDDSKEVGVALADIFGGPGEDAGIQFIKTLDLTKTSLEDLIDPTNQLVAIQQRQIEAEKQLATANQQLVSVTGPLTTELQLLGTQILVKVVQGLFQFLEIIKAIPQFLRDNKVELSALLGVLAFYNSTLIASTALQLKDNAVKAASIAYTKGLAAAQRVLNLVMKANPIGLVVTLVGALVIALSQAYKRSQEFRASLAGLGAVANEVFTIVKESVGRFVEGFQQLRSGNVKGAFKSFGDAVIRSNPIGLAFTEGKRLQEAFTKGYQDKIDSEAAESDQKKTLQSVIGSNLPDLGKAEGEATGDAVVEGIESGLSRSLSALESERDKIKEVLGDLSPDDPDFEPTLNKLKAVEREIKLIQDRIKSTSKDTKVDLNTEPAIGSIQALKNELSELRKSLETNPGDDESFIKSKLSDIASKETELEALETKVRKLKAELERQGDIAILEPLEDIGNVLDGQSINLQPITDELELQAQQQIQVLERQRLQRLAQLNQSNADEETFNRERKVINLQADAAILRQRLALAEQNSTEYLRIREEMFAKERELAEVSNTDIASDRVQAIQQYVTQGLDLIKTFSDSVFRSREEEVQRVRSLQLESLDEELQSRLDGVEEGSLEEKRIKQEVEAEKVDIETQAAKETKKIRIKQALINTALAVGNALATTQPFFPAGLIAAAIAAAKGAIEVAAIKKQSFAFGGHTGDNATAPDSSGERPAGIVHWKEYVAPRKVAEHPQGKKYIGKLEALRLAMGYPRSTRGHSYQSGGSVGSVGPGIDVGALAEQSVSVSVRFAEGEVEFLSDNVANATQAGSRQGSAEGLDDSLRLKERQEALTERTNV